MIPTRIILHHSLTKDSDTVSWGAIRRYHIETNNWSDIGYHFGIEQVKDYTEILFGRMPNKIGSHCKGHNTDSIGICFVGNFDNEPPPMDSWNKGVLLCKYLVEQFGIKIILGHTELNSHKTCPGRMFDLENFRKDVFF